MEENKQKIGGDGEELACKYLQSKGYKILGRNFRTRLGELDIVAKDQDELVVVEVKTRKNNDFGYPEEFVTRKKQQRIRRAALGYLSQNPHSNWRIDIISITLNPETKIEHIQNITS